MVFSTQRLKNSALNLVSYLWILCLFPARSHKSTVYLCNLKPYCRLLDEANDKDWT